MSVESNNVVVFDFDGTLYAGDSLFDFCLFYYRKKPLRIWFVLLQCFGFLVWKMGVISTTRFKSLFIGFLHSDSQSEVLRIAQLFWAGNRKFNSNVVDEFSRWKQEGVVLAVVSATPSLFLEPVVSRLGADVLLGTELIPSKIRYQIHENCRGEIKIKRLTSHFESYALRAAYSDNIDDLPMLKSASLGYFIKRNTITQI